MSENIIYFPGSKEFFNSKPSDKIRKKIEEIRSRRARYMVDNFQEDGAKFDNNIIKFPKSEDIENVEISNLKDLFYRRNLELRDVILNIKNIAERKRLRRKFLKKEV